MRRGEIYWADLGPEAGRRPVVILTRDAAIGVLASVTCAPVTRTIRSIRSEVEVGPEHGLPEVSVVNCDHVMTIPRQRLDRVPVGVMDAVGRSKLDQALRFALDIRF